MTKSEFDGQIGRLESQWRGGYGQERKALLWSAFQEVPVQDFIDAVSDCLASQRAAPLLEQLSSAVETAKTRRVSNHFTSGMGAAGFGDAIELAARSNKAADPDFVKCCMKLFADYSNKKLSYKQFLEGCDYLDGVARQLSPLKNRASTTSLVPARTRQSIYERDSND